MTGVDDSSGNVVATLTATADDGYVKKGQASLLLKNGQIIERSQ